MDVDLEEELFIEDEVEPQPQVQEDELTMNFENRLSHLIKELQMFKVTLSMKEVDKEYMETQEKELAEMRDRAEEMKKAVENVTTAIDRLLKEREIVVKKAAENETSFQLMESENVMLKSRIFELITQNEDLIRRVNHTDTVLALQDSAKNDLELQIEKFMPMLTLFEENAQRLEAELRRLQIEVNAAKLQQGLLQKITQHYERRLNVMNTNLMKAYDDISRLSAELGEKGNISMT